MSERSSRCSMGRPCGARALPDCGATLPSPWATAARLISRRDCARGPMQPTKGCAPPLPGRSKSWTSAKIGGENDDAILSAWSPLVKAGRSGLRDAENVGRAQPFGALLAFKLNGLAFIQGLVTLLLDGGEVDEDIFARVALDEAITLGAVEPLHYTLFLHARSPLMVGTALLPACTGPNAISRSGGLQGKSRRFPRSHHRRAVLQLWQDFATYARRKCEPTVPAIS